MNLYTKCQHKLNKNNIDWLTPNDFTLNDLKIDS